MYQQILTPVGGSLALSALVAALPILLLLVMLGTVRVKAQWAAAAGLLAAFIVALSVYRLPPVTALSGAAEGAATGLFPIIWIVLNAVWVNRLVEVSGYLDRVREAFVILSADVRVQALVVAFCFGGLLQAMAGFGAPIAVIAAILLALGFRPVRAATIALFADGAGTAFGSVGNPIVALSKATGLDTESLADMVGRQSAIMTFVVPFVLLVVIGGRRCLRELWPLALAMGSGFSAGQLVMSNFVAFQLADFVGAALATLAAVLVLSWWRPHRWVAVPDAGNSSDTGDPSDPGRRAVGDVEAPIGTGGAGGTDTTARTIEPRMVGATLVAFVPYGVLTGLLALVSLSPPVANTLGALTVAFNWPAIDVRGPDGAPMSMGEFSIDFVTATGTILLVTGLVAVVVLGVPWRTAAREYLASVTKIKYAATTVVLVLAFAYLLNYSGQAATIGAFFSQAGSAFVLLSPALGWLGVAATGSETSSSALFGAVQVASAEHIGISPYLLAAANTEAGTLGKLISPQSLAMAAAAVEISGQEGALLRRTMWWSIFYLSLFTAVVLLMAVGPLAWLVVH